MHLRIEPGDYEGMHVIRALRFCGEGTHTAIYDLIAGTFEGSLENTELAMILSPDLDSSSDIYERKWFENGWNHAFWLHAAPIRLALDADDSDGIVRDRVMSEFGDEAPCPDRVMLTSLNGAPLRTFLVQNPAQKVPLQIFGQTLKMLSERRTRRYFRTDPLPLNTLGHVLTQATARVLKCRVYENDVSEHKRNLLKSYGCWLEVGVLVFNVQGLEPGIYRFDIVSRQLQLLELGDYRDIASELIWNQPAPKTAAYTIALFVDFAQARWRYRHQRALRNIFIELGRVGQDLILAGLEVGVASFTTPAIKETAFCALYGVKPLCLFPAYTISQGS